MKRYPSPYHLEEDTTPSPAPRRIAMVLAVLLLLVSVGVWLAYWLSSNLQTRTSELVVAVTAPAQVRAGDLATWTIHLENKSAEVASDVSLDLNYPDGFVWKSASENFTGSRKNSWQLATLEPHVTRDITLQGVLLSPSDTKRTTYASLTYHFPNFRSTLQATAQGDTTVSAAPLSLVWAGPAETLPEAPATYQVTYTNNGTAELPESTLTLQLPSHFIVQSTLPTTTVSNVYQWTIPPLAPQASGSVGVVGQWSAEASGTETWGARLAAKADNGLSYALGQQSLTVAISPAPLNSAAMIIPPIISTP